MNNYSKDLKKVLGRWDSVAIVVAIVIGVGIFRVPAEVSRYLSSPILIILAWLLGGVISLLGALCYAELSSSFPETGGNYIYLSESYGRWAGFLFGWTELLVIRTGSIAAMAFISAEHMESFLSLGKSLIKPIALFIIVILSFINIFGLQHGKRLQNIFTLAKLLALLGMVVFGFISEKGELSHFYSAPLDFNIGVFPLIGLALIPILWTYGGWHENTFVAGETKDATKSLPFALITGTLVVIFFYIIINLLYIYLIPPDKMAGAKLIAADALQIISGRYGRKTLEAIVIISSLGAINGMIITGSRITYAMAKDNPVFRYIGKVDPRYESPLRAIIINAIWSAALVFLGTFGRLLFFTGVLVWLFFALVVGGLFIMRKKLPNLKRPYKVWGYPLAPLIFVIICFVLSVNILIFYPLQSFVGLCIMISGLPVYLLSQKMNEKKT